MTIRFFFNFFRYSFLLTQLLSCASIFNSKTEKIYIYSNPTQPTTAKIDSPGLMYPVEIEPGEMKAVIIKRSRSNHQLAINCNGTQKVIEHRTKIDYFNTFLGNLIFPPGIIIDLILPYGYETLDMNLNKICP